MLASNALLGISLAFSGSMTGITAFVYFFFHEVFRGVYEQFDELYVVANTKPGTRATILSLKSTAVTLGGLIGLPLMGVVAKHTSIGFEWQFAGSYLVLAMVFALFFRK